MDIQELKAKMQQAHRAEKAVEVCLRGDLLAEWTALDEQKDQLRRSGPDSLGDGRLSEIEEQMDEIAGVMRDATVSLRFRALPRKQWFDIIEKHPPREGNSKDRAIGLNQETFFAEIIPKSLVDPEMDKDTLNEFLDMITGAEYQAITVTIWALNEHEVSVPFSRTASQGTNNSAGTSKQQPARASRSGGGTGGNRKSTRSTSTKKADSSDQ